MKIQDIVEGDVVDSFSTRRKQQRLAKGGWEDPVTGIMHDEPPPQGQSEFAIVSGGGMDNDENWGATAHGGFYPTYQEAARALM